MTNAADNFQWQASNLQNVSQTLSYSWQNSGTAATVDQSSSITAGTATLAIRDGSGTQVYSADQKTGGSFSTSTGTAGTWTIVLTLSGVSGTVNFRVQKK